MTPRLLPYVLAFAVGGSAIGLLSYRSYVAQRRVLESGVGNELRGIASVKASQVAAWRAERLGDVRVLAANSVLMPSVRAVLEGSQSPSDRAGVWAWLEAVRANYRYAAVTLTDGTGRVRLATGESLGSGEYYGELTAQALAGRGVVLKDVGPGAGVTRAHFALAAGIRANGAALGAVILAVDPRTVLFPVTLQWPKATETAELLLVRRDGDSALYLSDLRRHPGSAMRRRESLTAAGSPAVRALQGSREVAHGVDADGRPVLSAASPVADSPWVVVTRIDQAEAFQPLGRDIAILAVMAGVLTVTLGIALAWLRRYQLSQFYRQQYEAESERRRLQEHFDQDRRQLEDQLRQSQKLESIGRLAGGVAHDFNNLLTVINGYSDLLASRLDHDESLKELAVQILKAGGRAAALTQQLLAFSRKQVTQPRALSLNALVNDSELMLSRLVGDDIEFVIETGAEADRVVADPGQLHQVLVNLVVNARDAMPGGGRLHVETLTVDDTMLDGVARIEQGATRYAVLRVTDTGTGMDEATRARIFEPFFTTKAPGRGTGLGLATVYGIVKQSDGVIQVRSSPGAGTSIDVCLPCTTAAVPAEPAAARRLALRGSETVLVVEDQHDVRSFVARSLRSFGYRVIEAANGLEALEASDAHHGSVDLLVTDVAMPGLNGRQLADRLRVARPDLRVLYMSGYSDDVLGERGVLDTGVAYLQKPFGPDELAASVRTALKQSRGPFRVLVIDDEAPIRALLQRLLTPRGYDVQLAAGLEEAGDLIAGHTDAGAEAPAYVPRFDVVVVDLALFEQPDFEAARSLRAELPAAKVIAMSGGFGLHSREMAAALRVDAIVAKPIEASRLYDAIDALAADPAPS